VECIVEEETRRHAEVNQEPSRKFTVRSFTEAFAHLNKLLRKSENMDSQC
jgi:hypothetical protein